MELFILFIPDPGIIIAFCICCYIICICICCYICMNYYCSGVMLPLAIICCICCICYICYICMAIMGFKPPAGIPGMPMPGVMPAAIGFIAF